MNKYIYCLFICILGLSSCVAQPLPINYIDAYNLHFSMEEDMVIEYPWMENAAYTGCSINVEMKESNRTLFAKNILKVFRLIVFERNLNREFYFLFIRKKKD